MNTQAKPSRWKFVLALLALGALGAVLIQGANAGWRNDDLREDPPSEYPDRVILTCTSDPSISQAITWRTDASVRQAYVEITPADPSPDFDENAVEIRAETVRFETDRRVDHYHSVNLAGLEPGTLYAFRVGGGDRWSEWFQFRTASPGPEPFSFIYLGDAQNEVLSHWSRAIRAAYADAPDARFMIHAGDLVTDGFCDRLWGEWFEAGGWIYAMMPSIPTPGNHEYDKDKKGATLTPHWRTQFTLPENGVEGLKEQCYYVDYQGVRVISLNSNERIEEQARWLDAVLSNNPNRWTVMTFHHPIFSSSRGRDNEDLRRSWKPLFDRHRVDLALQGHDHTYARGRNLPADGDAQDPGGGTMYVVSVSGPKMYDLTGDRWMDRAGQDIQLYQVISVTPDTLRYRAMTVTGDLYDAFDLVKREGAVNVLIDRAPSEIAERTSPAPATGG